MSRHVLIDMTGQVFGRLTVVARAQSHVTPSGQRKTCWHALCECGERTVVQASMLRAGRVQSCGCYQAELRIKHGRANRREVITYNTAHKRVRHERGSARQFPCVDCGGPALEWSYDHSDANELTEWITYSSGTRAEVSYSTDPSFYSPRCKSCHMRADIARKRQVDERTAVAR